MLCLEKGTEEELSSIVREQSRVTMNKTHKQIFHSAIHFIKQKHIKNLITKKQTVIPLKNIKNLKLHEKSMKNGHYHNIIVETQSEEYTLKGIYVNEMIQFFYELEKAVKQ